MNTLLMQPCLHQQQLQNKISSIFRTFAAYGRNIPN